MFSAGEAQSTWEGELRNSKRGVLLRLGSVPTTLACFILLSGVAEASFSNASLKGSYGYSFAKWTADSTQNAINSVGIFTFDGVSAVTYSDTDNNAGNIGTETGSGTYSVNANGTGSIILKNSGNGNTTKFSISINSGGKGFQILQTSCHDTCNNDVNTGIALAQQGTSFSNASLKGAFSVLTNTWTPTSTIPADANIGIVTFDGVSKVTASITSNAAGEGTANKSSGTYSVNSDGSGTLSLTNKDGQTTTVAFVINTAGKQFQYLLTSCIGACGNYVQSGTAIHQ